MNQLYPNSLYEIHNDTHFILINSSAMRSRLNYKHLLNHLEYNHLLFFSNDITKCSEQKHMQSILDKKLLSPYDKNPNNYYLKKFLHPERNYKKC